jgi:hypothetical protein
MNCGPLSFDYRARIVEQNQNGEAAKHGPAWGSRLRGYEAGAMPRGHGTPMWPLLNRISFR